MSVIDSIMAGLALVGNVEAIVSLAIGIVIGVIGGAIPGISATMAVALTLPFTFPMQPINGILLLLGVYKGGIFGGSIPAILIKTPGTPASSATPESDAAGRPSRSRFLVGVIFIIPSTDAGRCLGGQSHAAPNRHGTNRRSCRRRRRGRRCGRAVPG